jgi:hypothetical protein
MCADVEGVAGVVVEPSDDLGVLTAAEREVGEVGLALGRFFGWGVTRLCRVKVRAMELRETLTPWWCSRCQPMVSGPASSPDSASCLRILMIRSTLDCGIEVGLRWGRRDRGVKAASPSAR